MQYELSKSVTNQLKGIGIIFVIFGHLCLLDVIKMPSDKFDYAGVWGVTIFLILSGYGLTQSYFKSGIHFNFLYKRLSKVGIPYIVITLVWILIDKFVYNINYGFLQTIKVFLGINFKYSVDPTMWYITYIVMWYILFFIVFMLPIKDILKVMLIISLSVMLKVTSFTIIFDWNFYTMAFPIGIVFAYALSKLNKVNFNFNRYILLIPLTIVSFRLFLYYIFKVYDLTFYENLSISSIFLTFGIISFIVLIRFHSKILSFFGSISYELYLVEGKLLFNYGLPNISDILWIKILDYIITVMVSAYILTKIVRQINKSFINIKGKLEALK